MKSISRINFSEKFKQFIREYFWFFILFLVILGLRLFVFPLYTVDGKSMQNTLQHGQKILTLNFFEPNRFDVVIIDLPNRDPMVKRIIGLPGESIEYKNNRLYINDVLIDEDFLSENIDGKELFTEDLEQTNIPNNYYFVLGDNRNNSLDSRKLGLIHEDYIISKTLFIYWPINDISMID